MENAKKNLVAQITDLIQKYTEECLKINENEKDQEIANDSLPFSSNPIDFNTNDSNEYQQFSYFDEINNFFNERIEHNNKVIKFLKELRSGKHDDVFAYYDFKREPLSNQHNNIKTTSNLTSFISEDYPLVKKREQRKDIEMVSDPQMVLNFPTVSNLSKNLNSPLTTAKSSSPSIKDNSVEMPIRMSTVQKKRHPPSLKDVLFSQNQTKNIEKKEIMNSNNNNQSSQNKINSKPVTPPENSMINLTQDPSILTNKKSQNKPAGSQFSQPNTHLKFLDLYPPDPPLVFSPIFSQKNKKSNQQNINSKSSSTNDDNQQKDSLNDTKENQEDENNSPTKAVKTIINQKSELHFLSSNSSSNSSLPASFETEPTASHTKSPNPFTTPIQNKSQSPFRTTIFKPIISSPISNNFHFLTSTSTPNSDKNSRDNSSNSARSSLPKVPFYSYSSQNHSEQSTSSMKGSEEESEGQDSIVEFSSPIQRQNNDDEDESNQYKPIITGEAAFLSNDEDTETNIAQNKYDDFNNENETSTINANNKSEKNPPNSTLSKKSQTDSSSEFDESNLSQTLQPSGFIFQSNNPNSQKNMVRSSENPYTRLDAITRLPIRK